MSPPEPETRMTPEASPPLDTRAAHVDRSNKAFEQLKELFKTIGGALAIALVFRSFILEPFNIPSGSMVPNLLIGDYLLVEKWPYGYSRYSFPFGPPIFEGRIPDVQPHRGDVVVFKTPVDNRTDFIKRLIGLPGDQIQMRNGVLYLNGQMVPRKQVADAVIPVTREEDCAEWGTRFELTQRVPATGGETAVCRYRQFQETLPGGKSYTVIDQSANSPGDNTDVYVVPEGHYFMMGDNRDNSADSRFPPFGPAGGVGYVPAENLVGKAEIMFFSLDGSAHFWEVWKWPQSIRFSRIGKLL